MTNPRPLARATTARPGHGPRQPIDQVVAEVSDLLTPLADPIRAAAMSAYMKHVSDYFGISAPDRRRATSAWIRGFRGSQPGPDPGSTLLDAAAALFAQPQREFSYVAIDLLDRHRQTIPATALPRLRQLALTRPWWDTVDAMSSVIGRLAMVHPGWDGQVAGWATDPLMWARRIPLVFQVGRGAGVNLGLLFAICDANCEDTEFGGEFFMRKGIGWALRDAGRTHPEAVWDYVLSRRAKLSGLSYREATRRLPPRGDPAFLVGQT